jgi:hypothetical protein
METFHLSLIFKRGETPAEQTTRKAFTRRLYILDYWPIWRMPVTHPGFRIFVLGAGFSRLAGLPLANELFALIKDWIEQRPESSSASGCYDSCIFPMARY